MTTKILSIREYVHQLDWDNICKIHDSARLIELDGSVTEKAFIPLIDCYKGEELFNSTIKFSKELDSHIESNLENWTVDRLNVIDRLIMQMSLCEMIYLKSYDISHKVTISSAIENAKKFSSEDSTSFVNGVLDSIYKEL